MESALLLAERVLGEVLLLDVTREGVLALELVVVPGVGGALDGASQVLVRRVVEDDIVGRARHELVGRREVLLVGWRSGGEGRQHWVVSHRHGGWARILSDPAKLL